ncbi:MULTISPECIES: DUF6232 family protein [Methylosinus]|uniref:Uncharacterized protein n=1 Tax=Methylosinus trichosporium (strain ATCC 35070 / NCIMB 11131 / UNIQEM 75 / OB3b) TaxID=595536 RepID=A0A2D2CYE1_METT3|nr:MULTISPECIES: DUF6232 family protein [Methylosinus]ATQ67760.1 hypothetical protein CQW49_07535 [Methylosinus trichosporium OB3b]OBS51133.1 hypothetical protein A8B73_17575 [Methylosinus sp. 3S-1]
MTNQLIFSDERAIITAAIATLDGVSYPTAAISSLSVRQAPARHGCAIVILWLIALPLLAFGALAALVVVVEGVQYFSGTAPAVHAHEVRETIGPAGVALVLGLVVASFARHLARSNEVFELCIATSGAERVALASQDKDYLQRLRTAIEAAIQAAHGVRPPPAGV